MNVVGLRTSNKLLEATVTPCFLHNLMPLGVVLKWNIYAGMINANYFVER